MLPRILQRLRLGAFLFFHAAVAFLILQSYHSPKLPIQPVLFKTLLAGSNQGYVTPGYTLAPFKRFLGNAGTISLITDQPFGKNLEEEKFFHDAQNFLVPLLINPEPREVNAIVYCSSMETANRHVAETGYQWTALLSPGKGVAVKKT